MAIFVKMSFNENTKQKKEEANLDSVSRLVYERAMDMAPGAPLTSWADCTSIHNGQQHVAQRSLRNVPLIPLDSRILDRICAMKNKLASGTKVASPHSRQLSPTASAFLPAV